MGNRKPSITGNVTMSPLLKYICSRGIVTTISPVNLVNKIKMINVNTVKLLHICFPALYEISPLQKIYRI